MCLKWIIHIIIKHDFIQVLKLNDHNVFHPAGDYLGLHILDIDSSGIFCKWVQISHIGPPARDFKSDGGACGFEGDQFFGRDVTGGDPVPRRQVRKNKEVCIIFILTLLWKSKHWEMPSFCVGCKLQMEQIQYLILVHFDASW